MDLLKTIVDPRKPRGVRPNEIPKLPELLSPLSLKGAVVTADALHTQ